MESAQRRSWSGGQEPVCKWPRAQGCSRCYQTPLARSSPDRPRAPLSKWLGFSTCGLSRPQGTHTCRLGPSVALGAGLQPRRGGNCGSISQLSCPTAGHMKHILYSLHVSGRSHQEPAPLCKGCSVLPSLSYHLPHRPCWDHLPSELPVLEVSTWGNWGASQSFQDSLGV